MKCPNCGDNLVFDPTEQLLKCKSCGSSFRLTEPTKSTKKPIDGYDIENNISEKEAKVSVATEEKETSNNLEYTKFTCSSCGAELLGTYESSALGFCPYCGGESILSSRLQGKRPDFIIPFNKTKEECHEDYLELIDKVPFVPEELKDEDKIEEIRGIYIPYNVYHTYHKGDVDAEYSEDHGNTTYYYSLKGEVSSQINVPIDGSVQLDDIIGAKVFPYDKEVEKPFNEKYLATYYAELSDVDDDIYTDVVKDTTVKSEMDELKSYSDEHECENQRETIQDQVQITAKHTVLAPAYFLTYNNNDRVCYTVLPGFRGEYDTDIELKLHSYAEIPVNPAKYLLTVLISTIVLTVLLTVLPIQTFEHPFLLGLMSMCSAVMIILQGLSYKQQLAKQDYFATEGKVKAVISGFAVIVCLFILFSPIGSVALLMFSKINIIGILALVLGGINFADSVKIHNKYPDINISTSVISFITTVILAVLSMISKVVFFTDELSYGILIAASIPFIVCSLSLIKTFNEACSRPVPQFTREGGYNDAR